MILRFLRFEEYKFNRGIFIVAFCFVIILTFTSLFYTFLIEEGSLNHPTMMEQIFADSFYLWRFPTHYLLYVIIDIIPFIGILYLPLLIVNVMIYSISIERIITLLKSIFSKNAGN